ncbi:tRNA lysidine(34) synthetase TilS [Spirochaetia bacterium 38H-sp]|uniref:tRNA(Ile)-lysidine synthase n=1 Tax=Rarispira pelagica TaxID=3141764 RepID=A0ABU9UE56_9SPIR
MIKEKVISFFNMHPFLKRSRIAVALSGGPDSVALLHVLYELSSFFNLRLSVVYVEHGIRAYEERARERQMVLDYSKKYNLILHEKIVAPGFIEHVASEKSRSVEDVARDIRYDFFSSLVKEDKTDYIATAHTEDDQVETIFMRVLSGSDIFGLRGIPAIRLPYIRPLLTCTKEELLRYISELSLAYVVDSSNLSNDYLRNKIRNIAFPFLEKYFSGIKSGLLALSQKAEIFSKELQVLKTSLVWNYDSYGYYVDYNSFLHASEFERYMCLYEVFSMLGNNLPFSELPFKHIYGLIKDPKNISSIRLLSGRGFFLERCGDKIYVTRELAYGLENGYFLEVKTPGKYMLGNIGYVIIDFVEYGKNPVGTFSFPWCNERAFIIRSKKPGDVIEFSNHKKAINKFLQEWNVPVDRRGMLPIIEDTELGIVAILGSVFNKGQDIIRHGLPASTMQVAIKFLQER